MKKIVSYLNSSKCSHLISRISATPKGLNLPEDSKVSLWYDSRKLPYLYEYRYTDDENPVLPVCLNRDDRFIYHIILEGTEVLGDNLARLKGLLKSGKSCQYWNKVRIEYWDENIINYASLGDRLPLL